jgi:hypothetical protein
MRVTKSFLICLLITAILGSCDTLLHDSSESDAINPLVAIDKVYVPAVPGSSIIDLPSLLQVRQPVTLRINEAPQFGQLRESATPGLFEYSTPFISSRNDHFSYSVISAKGDLLSQQQMEIIQVERREQLPCTSILAFGDDYPNTATSGTVTLDVLANDWICDEMLSNIEITIIDGPKYGGVITIASDHTLAYAVSPNAVNQGFDKFIYQIRNTNNPAVVSQNVAYVFFSTKCLFNPGGNTLTIPIADATSLKFSPLYNAFLCGNSIDDVDLNIVVQTTRGSLTVNDKRFFTYTPADPNSTNYSDMFIYEVCLPNNECKRSIVKLELVNRGACTKTAVDDVFPVFSVEASGYDVERNDCSRESIQSLEIVSEPVSGTAFIDDSGSGEMSPDFTPKQRIRYTPGAGMTTDELTYRICFQDGTCSQAKARFMKIQ